MAKRTAKSGKPKGGKSPRKSTPTFNGVLVECQADGTFGIAPQGDVKARELPTVLRQAAIAAEKALGLE